MSKSKISLFCCIVGAAATVATAQPRAFVVRQNALGSTNPAGRLQVNDVAAGVASSLCLDFQGSSPAPGLHKGVQLRIGDATGGASGTVLIACASVAIDTAAPTHPGNTINVTSLVNCVGAPPNDAALALSNISGANLTLLATGSYLGEACWNVSADACGTFAIDYIGNTCPQGGVAPCGSTLFIGAGVSTTVAIIDNGADVNLGPANDDCADAAAASDGNTPYNLTCGTSDGDAAGCGGGDAADVWYSYTASCTGDLTLTAGAGETVTIYDPGVGCTPALANELGCGNPVSVVVSDGGVHLIKVSGAVGETGNLNIACDAFCTPGPAAGSAQTNAECGPPVPPSDCHLWFCDAALGCVSVNAPNGSACTGPGGDGLTCTINDTCQSGVCTGGGALDCDDDAICTFDECVEPGGCVNTDINAVPCIDITECPPGAATCSSDGDGTCDCVSSPDLCINATAGGPAPAAGECYDEGAQVVVTVEMGFSTEPICTAQFFLQYDNSCMDFVSITPGGGVFTNVVFQAVDEGAGTIDYAIGPPPGQICNGTQGPATIATIVFNGTADCKCDEVCFRPHNPATKLGAASGGQVCPAGHEGPLCHDLVAPCCSGAFNFDSTPPTLSCPGNVSGHADCAKVTKLVNFTLPGSASDNCDGSIPVNCTISHSNGVNVQHLLPIGGDFPPGTTTISCSNTADSCGNAVDCEFSVTNSGQNVVWVDVELSPTMKPGPVVRGINLSITDCGDIANGEPIEICTNATLGYPYNLPGHGSVHVKVPAGNYLCVQAWDGLHSLKAACDLTCVDMMGESGWYAAFKGSPDLNSSCHWLVQGNLNGDPNIDVIDYAEYLACIAGNALPGADTPCTYDEEADGLHCDINGDGIVSLADFSFIAVNFFDDDKAGCEVVCNPAAQAPAHAGPIGSISIRDLDRMGLGRVARMADMDRNGVVDMTDIALYANSGGVTSTRDSRPVAREGRDVKDGSSTSLRGSR